MEKIALTQGKYALVDDDDYKILKNKKWCVTTCGNKKKSYYAVTCYKYKMIYMHHIIMWKPKHLQIDHINHNGLDNRKENLRIVTASQNRQNKKSFSGLSRHKGVYLDKRLKYKKWHARIWKDDRCYSLGYFLSEEEAARAFNNAAQEMHGEYAVLNDV